MKRLNFLRGTLCAVSFWASAISAAEPLQITSFSSTSGPPGTRVTIIGENFADATAVYFNTAFAAPTVDFTGNQITATVPADATTGPIRVVTPAGTNTSAISFTISAAPLLVISSFSPTAGPVSTSVTITGQNFDSVTAVEFG